ncbi:carbamate kinase [Halobellus rufus]|uniref:carbamate kinase n=1 Tax=Halobellus rufus TaxID=1448860 RepID=UPI0006785A0A|nr:carbamate kinase [Halobellus rufus]
MEPTESSGGPPELDGPVVVALGGNALLDADEPWTADAQLAAVEETARRVATVVEDGVDLVVTHGNGPQVGNLLLQQEAESDAPQLPLDVVVAETQGQIGYLLQQALDNARAESRDSASPQGSDGGRSDEARSVTVVTRVVVDGDDPSFSTPTKPVGPFYSAAEASEKPFETREVDEGPKSHRRVVPSPEPLDVVETDTIEGLLDRGRAVVCGGGGGVPVVRGDDGRFRGVEAVVDKDHTSQVLANALGAGVLVVLTNVEYAYEHYRTDQQRPIREATPADLDAYLDAGEFAPGSMRPKIEACRRFVERGGRRAVVTTPENFHEGLAGQAGTQIRPAERDG